MARFRFAAALLLLLAGCTSDSPLAPQGGAAYPVTIPALSAEAQSALEAEFALENPRTCPGLDRFGFTHGVCLFHSEGIPADIDVNDLIESAKDMIARNSRFTGVTRPSQLVVARETHDSSELRIDFQPQIRSGLTVEGTDIFVIMDAKGPIWVVGHHYPEIRFPSRSHPVEEARASLLGLKIHYFDWTGPKDYVVDRDSFQGNPVRVIYPRETDAAIELHVAWQIHTGFFNVYVDTANLEVLGTRMLVRF